MFILFSQIAQPEEKIGMILYPVGVLEPPRVISEGRGPRVKPGKMTLNANELGALRLAVLLEPVCIDQPLCIVVGGLNDRGDERLLN